MTALGWIILGLAVIGAVGVIYLCYLVEDIALILGRGRHGHET